MANWTRNTNGASNKDGIRVAANMAWAVFTADGTLLDKGDGICAPSADQLVAWSAEAPAAAAEIATIEVAKATAAKIKRALYPGRCATTGRRFAKGAAIVETRNGWSIDDQTTRDRLPGGKDFDLEYEMSKSNSDY